MQQCARNKFYHPLFLFPILLAILSFNCGKKTEPFHRTQLKMGTYVSVSIYDQNMSQDKLSKAVSEVFKTIDDIESVTSRHLSSSELNKINNAEKDKWLVVDTLLHGVISSGLKVSEKTGGLFDPTIAPILDLWNFNNDSPQKPEIGEINKKLSLVDYKYVKLESGRIKFLRSGMAIDLGGIAKGTAIDAAVNVLKKAGFSDFLVDAGGDLAINSSELTEGKIRIWIRHPRKMESFFGYLFLNEGCVATSGDYEQYFEQNGQRYFHLINPDTGFPDSDLVSVTVVANSAELADAYSTGIFIMGWEKGIKFAKTHSELGVIILAKGSNKIKYWISNSLMEKIQIVDDSLL